MCKKGYTYLLVMMAGLNLISFYIDHGLLNKMVTAMKGYIFSDQR